MKGELPTIINHPDEFKTGYRVLMRTLRSKDGGKVNKPDRVAEKVVTRNKEEWEEALSELLAKRRGQERIYSTVDERDMTKAIRLFKYRQLDADYFDKESLESFYVDIWNRFISSIQNPSSAKTSFFMVDIDEKDDEFAIKKEIEEKGIELVYEYPTKNGRHLVLSPFDPNTVTFDIQKNGMLLVAYNGYYTEKISLTSPSKLKKD